MGYFVSGIVFQSCVAIESVDETNLELAAYSLLYLKTNNWTISKLIISKVKDKNILFKLLNIKNNDNESILHRIVQTNKNKFVINWYLADIIPSNHPILLCKDKLNG